MENKKGLWFWEAMKALEEGKKVRNEGMAIGEYVHRQSSFRIFKSDVGKDDWEIVEEPELYWQWRRRGIPIQGGRIDQIKNIRLIVGTVDELEKHAGPWIKTKDGFEKHETWEQF